MRNLRKLYLNALHHLLNGLVQRVTAVLLPQNLPVVNKRVLTSADEDERITAFCINSQNIFETCADAIIEAQKNKTGCPRMMFT